MSVSADIFAFPSRGGPSGNWSNQNLADVYRCIDQFARHGIVLEAASGLSEEGDPWFALEDVASGDAVIHIARIDGFYVVHVMDGESWRADDLRAALSNLDPTGFMPHHDPVADAAIDGDDDGDHGGTHAFLRIVSAIVAVLTADVIASAVAHDAMASPLPDVSAAGAGDHAANDSIEMPALPELHTAEISDRRSHELATEPESGHTSAVSAPPDADDHAAPIDAALVVTPPPVLQPIAEADDFDAAQIIRIAEMPAPVIAVQTGMPVAVPQEIHFAVGDTARFTGTDASDLFIVITRDGQKTVALSVDGFEQGKDNVVVEQQHEDGSISSGIILDGAKLADLISLALLGQPQGDVGGSGG